MSTAPERVEIEPGYSISRIIQGGWQISAGHRLKERAGAGEPTDWVEQLARRALTGKTTFDCADIYTGVEEALGAVRRRVLELGGDEPQIHTKCVPDLGRLADLQRRDLEATIDRSLRRLGVERLDLVQFHWWDLEIPGWIEAATWLDEMRRAGKIRLLGATNFPTSALRRLLEAGIPIRTHQVQYSLLDRRPSQAMTDLCRGHGVHLLCYGALAGGLLSSRFLRAGLPADPRNRSEVKYRLIVEEAGGWPRVERLLDRLEELRGPRSEDPAPGEEREQAEQAERVAPLAVRWVLEQDCVAAAIVGASPRRDLTLSEVMGLDEAVVDRLRSLPGDLVQSPAGDVYELERDREGRHGRIMRYDLQVERK